MNKVHVQWELTEALVHLQTLVSTLSDVTMTPGGRSELAVELGHILDHFCYAWNGQDMTTDQLQELPQQEFDRLSNTVPNFGGTRTMGPTAC